MSDPVKLHVKENDGSITICVMLVGEFPSNKTSLTDMFSTSEDTAGELVDTNTFMLQMYGITVSYYNQKPCMLALYFYSISTLQCPALKVYSNMC